MKTSEVFKEAKKHLAKSNVTYKSKKQMYICHAILCTSCTDYAKTRTRKIIHSYLDGIASFPTWLLLKHDIDYVYDMDKLQQTRHAWLDHLIEHYESIGD